MTKGEQVLSMPNDTIWWPIDFLLCIILKTSADTSIITWTVKFLRYLLTLAKQMADSLPAIVFLHSQGAIFIEHAIELLSQSERKQLRIFTFGGGSFIPPGKCHPDSHNYASAADFVCRFSSPNLQLLALERYYGYKEGLNDEKIIARLSFKDAIFHLDSNMHDRVIYAEETYQEAQKTFEKTPLTLFKRVSKGVKNFISNSIHYDEQY
jgi:hypothetical protein